MQNILRLAAMAALFGALSGCVTAKPWPEETSLAATPESAPAMETARSALQGASGHRAGATVARL